MISELLANLRGVLGTAVNAFSNPLFGLWIMIGLYLLWRRTSRT